MEDIFQRKKRRRPFARLGGFFFAVLAVVSLVDAVRAAPLSFGGGNDASTFEAVIYRLAAASFCGALALWLLRTDRAATRDADRLLR
ncbi:hypothetical protein [Vulgatibacter sp.]|uniref:hypothetical protein n=1 Tax=Vulgatibacter sp. TaxID=1971226 RepID=UPI003566B785